MRALFRTADTPWGTMPFLEVDGKRIGGSPVIARFLAERFGRCCRHVPSSDALGCYVRHLLPPGLAGSDDVENAQIAAVLVAVEDISTEVVKLFFEKDESKKVRSLSKRPAAPLVHAVSLVPWCRLL